MPEPNRRPNLIYVFADQLRYVSCGLAGDPYAHTPNMDRLAAQGVNCVNATVSTPVCAAYRASLFTGTFQSTHGMVINELRLSPAHECFGHVVTRHNYRTAYIGKWHLWANELGHHDRVRNAFVPPGPYRLGFDGYWAGYNFNHNAYGATYFEDTCEPIPYEGYEADAQTDMAIDFVRGAAAGDDPFALFLSWGPPHDPWGPENTPPEDLEMFRDADLRPRPNFSADQDAHADAWATMGADYLDNLQAHMRGYYAQVAGIDRNLGRIMSALDALDIADETILVFTSDHGEMFGSHGRRAKNIFYDEAARVPFLIRQPGRLPAGRTCEVCLNTPDMMPTLLSLMGLPVPGAAEGADLCRSLTGEGADDAHAAFMQGMGTTAAWRDGSEWRAVRDRQYTYAVYRQDRQELLFDRTNDPYQMTNLADDASQQSLLRHYRDMLARWMRDQGDTFEACTWYERHWTEDRNVIRGAKGGTHDLDALAEIIRTHFPGDAL